MLILVRIEPITASRSHGHWQRVTGRLSINLCWPDRTWITDSEVLRVAVTVSELVSHDDAQIRVPGPVRHGHGLALADLASDRDSDHHEVTVPPLGLENQGHGLWRRSGSGSGAGPTASLVHGS